MRIELPDLSATDALALRIAKCLRAGDVIALTGGLGAGKTTLARSILAALGYVDEVPSPTFTIIETYDPPSVRLGVAHADFYRLDSPEEAEELGIDDYREGRALIAEWPEKAGGFAHDPACLSIMIENEGNVRMAIVEAGADWLGRMP